MVVANQLRYDINEPSILDRVLNHGPFLAGLVLQKVCGMIFSSSNFNVNTHPNVSWAYV